MSTNALAAIGVILLITMWVAALAEGLRAACRNDQQRQRRPWKWLPEECQWNDRAPEVEEEKRQADEIPACR